ncbi:MAG TPA: metalloregulator ArsR/SmtB family transcription factor [Myxococcaceae bacterium]|nr:metalloregulator ArsR/SmtB family transcription factor [Myxococcaceae bacterium]
MCPRRAEAARDTAGLKASAHLFAALGDPTRLALVRRLCSGGPMSITQLSDGAGVTRQAVSKHLHVLEEAGVVRGARAGRERIWELEPRSLEDARAALDRISQQWDEALGRLKHFVERE